MSRSVFGPMTPALPDVKALMAVRPSTHDVDAMRVVKKIGEGGLSVVYLAEAMVDGEPLRAALKVIRPQFARDRAAVHRFAPPSRASCSRWNRPDSRRSFWLGQLETRGQPWRRPPHTLRARRWRKGSTRTGSLHINEARPFSSACSRRSAAAQARAFLLASRSRNVFVRANGDEGSGETTGVLVDGGDRLLTRQSSPPPPPACLPVLGTAKAMAPDRRAGSRSDRRTDIYQMGTLMYEVRRAPIPRGSRRST